ncbi:MAG: DUF2911 domain-containing protein [Saprospiraceae bacterium]|nr:DUF2911 domain-containing protein [Saprospiraceae bacterium]
MSIETFTISGRCLFGRAIHLFPEPHSQQFLFEYDEKGSISSLDIQHYDLTNTSIPLESKTGFLPYTIRMRHHHDTIHFLITNQEGIQEIKYPANRMDYLGSWIPIFGQWQYLSSLTPNNQLGDGLTYANKTLGVYELDLKQESDNTVVFYGGLSMPLTFFVGENQKIDSISGIGSAWNFEISRQNPIDIEKFAGVFAQKPVLGVVSPRDSFATIINDTEFKITYFRPFKRNRKIFGHIVPYNRVWRAGANWATKIAFDQDLSIEGISIPKGTYNIFTIPRENNQWTLILNTEKNAFGQCISLAFRLC